MELFVAVAVLLAFIAALTWILKRRGATYGRNAKPYDYRDEYGKYGPTGTVEKHGYGAPGDLP